MPGRPQPDQLIPHQARRGSCRVVARPRSRPAVRRSSSTVGRHEALDAWRRRAGRGVVEAVTGTGKTMVGIAAAGEELARGGQVLVLVPTRELLDQWSQALARHGPRHARIGRLGGGHRDELGHCDVLIAVVNSARDADLRPRRPGGLLVADECHRYGSDGNRVALQADFTRRLGLSATYARVRRRTPDLARSLLRRHVLSHGVPPCHRATASLRRSLLPCSVLS